MTPKELYDSPAAEIYQCPEDLSKHMEEVDFDRITADSMPGLEVRMYANHCSDGERVWQLFSIWLDGRPFMVCQEAGRGGRDHNEKFVTDQAVYAEAVARLVALYDPIDPPDPEGCYDANEDMPCLDRFYGRTLADYYDKSFIASYNVGDIVIAKVPVNHLTRVGGTVVARVEIGRVHAFNPRHTYSGLQLDRRWATGDVREMIFDQDKGEVHATFAEADIVSLVAAAPVR